MNWSANVISLTLGFTSMLRDFQNGIVHGHTMDGNESRARTALQVEVSAAYDAYRVENS
jgi:hypothetical protein